MYQGHKNRAHWNVALYLANEEPLYRLCQRHMNRRSGTVDEKARRIFAELKGQKTPDGVAYSYSAVRAALANWEGI